MTHRLIVGGELVLYGDVGDMWGDGSGFTAREVVEALAELGPGDITVRINSGGGNVFEGSAVYSALLAHPGRVTTLCDGLAASAASVIFIAGERRIVNALGIVMIHDPASITLGTAADHEKTAETLNKFGGMFAAIYASRTGGTVEAMREMMLAETWMSADEAVALGFAHETEAAEEAPVAAARFDYTLYSRTPAPLLQEAQRARPVDPVASATERKEMDMTMKPGTADTPAAPTSAAKDQTRDILARCTTAKLSLEEANKVVADAGGDLSKAQDLIIAMVAEKRGGVDTNPVNPGASAHVTADARDRFREGATRSLLMKTGHTGGEVNEFSGMTLRELARHYLMMVGDKTHYPDPLQMAGAALNFRMSVGMHSTSDFTQILANVANKSMLKGWEESPETFEQWTARGVLTDFKPIRRVDLNLMPSLAEVPDGAEYTHGTIGDRGETIQLATYGKMFAITRHTIINDDLNAFSRIPMKMGRAARRTVGNMVYAVLTANAPMADGIALFHADHDNLGSGAITATNVSAGRAAMARQTDPDGHATGGLNIRPAFMLVPVELESAARRLMESEFDPSGTQRIPNVVRGMTQVVSEARLSAADTAAWYLAADPSMHDTIEVAYLNGNSNPTLEQRDGFNVDGVEFKVRIDAGVKDLDFRGLYKSTGS